MLLVGPSGSGKSTLLRALAGLLLTVDSGDLTGTVTIEGSPPGERPGAVGLVLQEPGSGTVAATVGRDVAFGLENVGVAADAMPARVAAALTAVGLGDLDPATPTSALSGGQTQRVALAGALALQPSLLLLDEPTAMLDETSAATVRDAVLRGAAGVSTIVVEHRIEPWVEHCERLVVLGRDGRVLHDGPPAVVLEEHGPRLAAEGIWVPGVAAPEPLSVPLGPLARPVDGGAPLLQGEALRVERRRNHLDGSSESATALVAQPLAVTGGRATALVGPSGGGKSTWLAALAGLVTPVSGRVTTAEGREVGELPATEIAPLLGWVPHVELQRAAHAHRARRGAAHRPHARRARRGRRHGPGPTAARGPRARPPRAGGPADPLGWRAASPRRRRSPRPRSRSSARRRADRRAGPRHLGRGRRAAPRAACPRWCRRHGLPRPRPHGPRRRRRAGVTPFAGADPLHAPRGPVGLWSAVALRRRRDPDGRRGALARLAHLARRPRAARGGRGHRAGQPARPRLGRRAVVRVGDPAPAGARRRGRRRVVDLAPRVA
ncbi:ABC transporter [Janibacter hoylei PVAS-1]|uniref:ABC transporter n=1 Tax=Janibacter hoylei PVAS-1 TaxID=1210046 RepID=K1E4W7_9MICO|nr:ABC transporter [Janibacter hoylei PVAS-1]